MIFYIAKRETGGRQLCTTQAEARDIDKGFVQLDIPTDKAGLRDALQELLDLADAAQASIPTSEAENTPQSAQIEPQALSVPQTALQFREMVENQWQDHPLAWRIDLAHQTIEECRKALPWPHKETQTNEQSPST